MFLKLIGTKNYMSLTNTFTFYLLFILAFLRVATSSEINQDFNLSEIAENNYVHLGKHVSIEDRGNDDIANIGFIIGADCVAIIDTGGSINIGKKLKSSVHKITKKPICYVINTHVHFDHILGNKTFVNENTDFVGHKNLLQAVNQNRNFFLTQFKNNLSSDAKESDIIGPNILIEKTTQLELGGRTLTLIPFSASHSHNDLVVIDNKTKTLWSGDLIFRERIPSLTGSLKGWLETIEKIKKLDVNVVVPGHGNIASSLDDAIKQQEDYLNLLLNKTREAINKGKFIIEAMETIDQDNQLKWILHDYQHSTNINKAYTELEWE
jgi:quinoprotein relay system zinc metallohydrolase 2